MGTTVLDMGTDSVTLGNALFGVTRQAVLGLLFGHPGQRYCQRQIIETLGVGSGTVQRELALPAHAGILTRFLKAGRPISRPIRNARSLMSFVVLYGKVLGSQTS